MYALKQPQIPNSGCPRTRTDLAPHVHMLMRFLQLSLSAFRHSTFSRPFSTTIPNKMRVVPVPVRSDNYAYLLIDEQTMKAAAVDPYDMVRVQAAAQEEGVQIVANLTTHHHYDHSGGNRVNHHSCLHQSIQLTRHSNARTTYAHTLYTQQFIHSYPDQSRPLHILEPHSMVVPTKVQRLLIL